MLQTKLGHNVGTTYNSDGKAHNNAIQLTANKFWDNVRLQRSPHYIAFQV